MFGNNKLPTYIKYDTHSYTKLNYLYSQQFYHVPLGHLLYFSYIKCVKMRNDKSPKSVPKLRNQKLQPNKFEPYIYACIRAKESGLPMIDHGVGSEFWWLFMITHGISMIDHGPMQCHVYSVILAHNELIERNFLSVCNQLRLFI